MRHDGTMANSEILAASEPRSPIFGYRRHRPEETPLYPIIESALATLHDRMAERASSLPGFVSREFEDYLRCGRLEHGFVRVKCDGCRHELLVGFSCKRRGFCPSCGTSRMAESAAHLIDHVLPKVPIRQWVVSFPWPLRMLFAARPEALSRCLAVITRAIQTDLTQRAGLKVSSGARTGVVTVIQRFGSALNLNIHLHMLILDGVYTFENGGPRFHRLGAPDHDRLRRLLDRLIRRILRRLVADGLLIHESEQPWLELETDEAMDTLAAASIRYRIAVGPQTGRRTLTIVDPHLVRESGKKSMHKPLTASQDNFSLNAAVVCQPHQRQRLERLCRYVLRPPLSLDRLSVGVDGRVRYALKNPWQNGTTHVVFDADDFVARLAALVPRPRLHLTRYHGVLAPNSPYRSQLVPSPKSRDRRQASKQPCRSTTFAEKRAESDVGQLQPLTWAKRLKRVFDIDISVCPNCGGRLRVIGDVTEPDLIRKILNHVAQRGPPA